MELMVAKACDQGDWCHGSSSPFPRPSPLHSGVEEVSTSFLEQFLADCAASFVCLFNRSTGQAAAIIAHLGP